MFARLRRLAPLVLVVVLLVSAFLRTVGLAAFSSPDTAQSARLDFGPRLYLLLTADEDLPALLPATVVVHAQLHVQLGDHFVTRYIASGGVADQASMDAAGITVRLLDEPSPDRVYYFADANADNATRLAAQFGRVIYADDMLLLIAAPADKEQAMLDALLAAGVSLSALTAQPLQLRADDVSVAEGAAKLGVAGADPTIAGLLPLVSADDLRTRIEELSGARTVTIQGEETTIRTRYTFSSAILTAEDYLYQYYADLALSPEYFAWTNGNFGGRNVIAEIPGVNHPRRVWLVGGHFDSISEDPYSSAPGADDNGTGTAATMLIARLLRDFEFVDTIRFVHFSGEEQGQWGSKAYAAALSQGNEEIKGFINLDMIGYDGNGDHRLELHTGLSAGAIALGEAFATNNDDYAQGLQIERKTTSASRFSDHSPFWDAGAPAFLAIEDFFDNSDVGDRDRNPQYHRTGDSIDLVDLDYVMRTTRTALATVAELAGLLGPRSDETPTVTLTPTASATPTVLPVGCANLLVNGDFEGNEGWQFGTTPFSAGYDSSIQFDGQRSLRLGIPISESNRLAHSSAFQLVTLPPDASEITLRYRQQPGGGSDGVDYYETLLLDEEYGFLTTLARDYAPANTAVWRERTFTLNRFSGQAVVVYFNVFNNGAAAQQWNYIDHAELIVCAPSLPVETPTPTPTMTPTPTESQAGETATPTSTATDEPTGATATPTLVATVPAEDDYSLYLPFVLR